MLRASAAVIALVTGACTTQAPQGPVPVETRFEFPRNQIVVKAQLAGRGEHACLIDTGTNPSGLDRKLADQLGLAITGPGGQAEGVGAESVTVHATQVEVALPGTVPSRIDTLTGDLSRISEKIGTPIGCILGQSWLTTRIVQIDYPKRVVRFPSEAPAAGAGCETFPMRYWVEDDAMPLVEVKVLGVSYPVTLDTGSSSTLKLFVKDDPPPGFTPTQDSAKTVTGFRGASTVVPAKVATLSFGPIALRDVEINMGERNLDEPPGARMGNLGNGVLQHGVLTLDYPSRRVTICAAPAGEGS